MASSSSSSSLGRISILKSCIESSSAASSSGGSFYYYQNRNLKFNQQKQQQMRIVAQGCSTSNVDRRSAVSSDSSSSSMTNGYLDTVFGTELKKKQKQQRQDNEVIREIKVGIDGEQQEVPKISADKLDEWMEFSVPEIVKNIGDAPLLVQIYSSMSKGVQGLSSIGSSSSSSSSPAAARPIPVLEKMKADAKSWTGVTKRWEEGSPVPDGIILVEQLKAEDAKDESEVIGDDVSDGSGSTKTWGVVIQGRGVESASSCYILKTCRVGSSLGFCTHFCLARAKCFGESADLQLKNSWLLGH
ncbi:hypothetical protein MKW94_018150 [Papaver nudicaule]|uniref:DUF7804 domain-containing protein n=1 Tax=Papaver nudicaule TaxID=74823 RepID=A0AA42B565_PAPNU|nr:hypothetical protein [Papaver nudicaule]